MPMPALASATASAAAGIARRLGANTGQLTGLIAINLVIGFMPGSNISWQAHIGGLIAGGLVAYVYTKTRGVNDTSKRRLTVV